MDAPHPILLAMQSTRQTHWPLLSSPFFLRPNRPFRERWQSSVIDGAWQDEEPTDLAASALLAVSSVAKPLASEHRKPQLEPRACFLSYLEPGNKGPDAIYR